MSDTSENVDFLKEVIDDYIVETGELLQQAEQDLLSLEENPGSEDLLNRVFRAFHTIKGTSSFLGFEKMAALTHRAEDVLNLLRHGEAAVDTRVIDLILRVVDTARALLEQIKASGEEGETSIDSVLGDLTKWLEAVDTAGGSAESDSASEDSAGASETSGSQEVREENPPAAARADSDARRSSSTGSEQTVRVNVSRLDEIMDLVGELVLVRNRIQQLVQQVGRIVKHSCAEPEDLAVDQLVGAAEQLQFVTSQLQDAVMRTRMLPISNVFHRFPRLVRDLAKEKGKEVRLVLEGEETELDKSVLELVSDPLVHLIRNAVDHGIETPEERERLGKPRTGTVRLGAYHEGDHIVIEIEDDGRGIDPERVRRAAVERGLMDEEEVSRLGDREALDLIFLPGFSTASRVTGTSGRGVGMDVVKTNITRLNGQIAVESEVGVGTRFIVRLPLTLVIVPGLMVEAAGQTVVIPLSSVLETARLQDHGVNTVGGSPMLRLRDEVIPLVDLGEVLGLRHGERMLKGYAVIVGLANRRAGILVDHLRGQAEIVVKPLGGFLSRTRVFAGATILGDGKVRLVLDVGEVLRIAQEGEGEFARSLVERTAEATGSAQVPAGAEA